MIFHYKMVVVSIFSVILLLTLLLLFKKFFPKRNIPKKVLLIFISLLPLVSMLRPGTYESGDLSIHVSFAIPFFEALKEGNIFPVWNQYVLSGYGYPLYAFVYPLPYYLVSFLHFFGISFIEAFKLIAGASYVFSAYAMYLFVKEELKNEMSAYIAAIFFLFAPYHLVDLHFRFSIGEILAFSILPLCFYLTKKILTGGSYRYFFLLSVSVGLLILSHQAISLISVALLIFYNIFLYLGEKNIKIFLLRFISLIMGIIISSFYWLPLLIESQYTHLFQMSPSFPPFLSLFFSTSRYGLLYQGNRGELFFPVGYIHLILIIISIFVFMIPALRKKYSSLDKKFYYFSFIFLILSLFMMLSISEPFWNNIPLLTGFQFSYRLSLFTAFFSSIIAGIVLSKLNNIKIIYFILSITILITILNWGNRRTIPEINDNVLEQGLLSTLNNVGYGSTIWTKSELKKRDQNIKVLKGNSLIKEITKKPTHHEYIISVESNQALLRENTTYFPNWIINVDGNSYVLDDSDLENGLITFKLPQGLHLVEVRYEETLVRKLAKVISSFTLILLLLPFINKKIIKKI